MVATFWLWLALPAALAPLAAWLLLRCWARRCAAAGHLARSLEGKETIGFFHPYAHSGGGGERVLWCAVSAVQQHHPGVHCVVYTGDVDVTPGEMLSHARSRFGIELDTQSVHFAFLRGRRWVDAVTWPRFTLLGQSLGSMLLGWEALCHFRPDVFVDTMGYAFTFPIFALLGGCRIGCYVHYPTISTDMLARVRSRDVGVCNDAAIARSGILSNAKLVYYQLFAALYGFVGRFAEVVMVNSSWTHGHIDSLWRVPGRTTTVFPPCDTAALAALPLERGQKEGGGRLVLSLAQFRPEKNHALQLHAFARFLREAPQYREPGSERVRFVLAGGCRDAGDAQRVETLRALCTELGLREKGGEGSDADWDVCFRTNIPLGEMQELLGQADVGLHTMREEHFGISVVEFMAAGAVPLAHNSGGPAMDIVTPLKGERTGFLATDAAGYVAALQEIFALGAEGRLRVATAARESVRGRFSQEAFEEVIASRLVAPLRSGNGPKQ
mmetsp:Transcript_36072/g.114670  ORF Transcript_36072/g.114670 Transcript_36072/m.114670 type:complete len:498 (-) Transcript_36072:175-1668(-)